MTEKWRKFIHKNDKKEILEKIIQDISKNKLSGYYLKPLKGYKHYYRIRKGTIRIVFEKSDIENKIVAVDTRGQIYRGLK